MRTEKVDIGGLVYTVFSNGDVYSNNRGWHWIKLKPDINNNGYAIVRIGRPTRAISVHRLVLFVFRRAPQEGEIARHKDNNKLNNDISNLRWGTYKDNWTDRKATWPEFKGFSKLWKRPGSYKGFKRKANHDR